MDNIVDTRYSFVMTYANKILALKNKLQNAKTNHEKQHINSAIDNYKSYIDKYTNNSSDYILTCAQKINSAKQKINEEQDENKKEILEYGLNSYINNVKSHILKEYFSAKETKFRNSQRVNINAMLQANEISKMCETHQQELKKEKQMREQISHNSQMASGSER